MADNDVTVVDLRDAPVTIDVDALGNHDSVMAAVAQFYELQGLATQQLWVGDVDGLPATMFDVAIPDRKLVIDIETVENLSGIDVHRYRPWREAGWEVWVLVPERNLQMVKKRLVGHVDHIQGWRLNGPQVTFDQPIAG